MSAASSGINRRTSPRISLTIAVAGPARLASMAVTAAMNVGREVVEEVLSFAARESSEEHVQRGAHGGLRVSVVGAAPASCGDQPAVGGRRRRRGVVAK